MIWIGVTIAALAVSLGFKFFKFTGLILPIALIFILSEVEKANIFNNNIVDEVGLFLLAASIIYVLLRIVRNLIRLFNPNFTYFKRKSYSNKIYEDSNGNIVLPDGRVLKDITNNINK